MGESSTGGLKEAAARGFSHAADAYAAARPSYPTEAVGYVVRELNITSDSHVVDLGAGTGLLTALFVPVTSHITAIEPVTEMREKLRERLPGVDALPGTAESLPLEPSSVDAVLVAQAFHWFEPTEALEEIHRCLKPAGGVALLWNVRDTSTGWMKKYEETISPYRSQGRTYDSPEWRAAVESTDLFDDFEHRGFPYTQTLSKERFLTRLESTAYVVNLAEDERADLVERVQRLIDGDSGLSNSDVVEIPYETHVYCSHKKG